MWEANLLKPARTQIPMNHDQTPNYLILHHVILFLTILGPHYE